MKYSRHIILLIIVLISLYSLYNFFTTNHVYEIRHYLCFILIGLAITFLAVKNEKISFLITFTILVLSTFDLLRYSLITNKIGISINIYDLDIGISVQTRSLIFLIIFIVLNRDFVFQIFTNLSELIAKYKHQYNKK